MSWKSRKWRKRRRKAKLGIAGRRTGWAGEGGALNSLWLPGGNDGGTEQNEALNVFVKGDKRSVCCWNQPASRPAPENRHFSATLNICISRLRTQHGETYLHAPHSTPRTHPAPSPPSPWCCIPGGKPVNCACIVIFLFFF